MKEISSDPKATSLIVETEIPVRRAPSPSPAPAPAPASAPAPAHAPVVAPAVVPAVPPPSAAPAAVPFSSAGPTSFSKIDEFFKQQRQQLGAAPPSEKIQPTEARPPPVRQPAQPPPLRSEGYSGPRQDPPSMSSAIEQRPPPARQPAQQELQQQLPPRSGGYFGQVPSSMSSAANMQLPATSIGPPTYAGGATLPASSLGPQFPLSMTAQPNPAASDRSGNQYRPPPMSSFDPPQQRSAAPGGPQGVPPPSSRAGVYDPSQPTSDAGGSANASVEKNRVTLELDQLRQAGKIRFSWLEIDQVFLVVRKDDKTRNEVFSRVASYADLVKLKADIYSH